MAVSVTCIGVVQSPAGRWYVNWDDGSQTEYASLADMQAAVGDLDKDKALAKLWHMALWLAKDRDAKDPSKIKDKTLTIDLTASSPVKVQ